MKLNCHIKPAYKPRRYNVKRNYDSALVTNLTASWTTTPKSMDQVIQHNLQTLRARSREQFQNNDYMLRFVSLVKQNVIGQGISFQSRVVNPDGTQDKTANQRIELAWKDFSKRQNCDIEGRLNLTEMTKLYIATIAEDGETVVRMHYGEGKHGLQLQFLDPERLAFHYNVDLPGGEYVRFGIHFDGNSRRLGYYFDHTNQYFYNYASSEKPPLYIPANEIIHEYIVLKAGQKRGIPWASTALLRLNMLGGYEEAALVNARTGASKMGFFTSPDGSSYTGDDQYEDGSLITNAEANSFEQLPAGVEFQTYNPDYPNNEFDKFVKQILRGIGSGLNVSYHTLANDLSDVNYSSARIGELNDREVWKMLQDWVIESFLHPVYEKWLQTSLLSGQITSPMGNPLPYSQYDKFNVPMFQGRRWQWVDPLKEANAQKILIDNNLKSRSEIIREQGRDPEDVWMEIQRERETMESLGIAPEQSEPTETMQEGETDAE